MTEILCPFCSAIIIEDFNEIIDLDSIKYFQCPDPKCNRIIGNPFYEKNINHACSPQL